MASDNTQRTGKAAPYQPPQPSVLMKKSNDRLLKQFVKYATQVRLDPGEVCIQRSVLPRIILRVDKRREYFMIFHNGTKINEIKQAALTAYWILKFRPFMINTEDPDRSHKYARINEGFALFYILSACEEYARRKGFAERTMSKRLTKEILYSFTYWDLSKEAVILVAETIGEAFWGIPAEGMGKVELDG